MTRRTTTLAFVATLLAAAPAGAQDAVAAKWGIAHLGVGVMTGTLSFEGAQFPELLVDGAPVNDVLIRTSVKGAPSLRAGVEYFFDRPFGVHANAELGYASIELPTARDENKQIPKLELLPFRFRGHFIYRFSFSGSPNSIGVQLELGTEVVGYRVQDNQFAQRVEEEEDRDKRVEAGDDCKGTACGIGKAVLVSTTIVGPSMRPSTRHSSPAWTSSPSSGPSASAPRAASSTSMPATCWH